MILKEKKKIRKKFIVTDPVSFRQKRSLPGRSHVQYRNLLGEKSSCLVPHGLSIDICFVASASKPLLSLFKVSPMRHKRLHRGVICFI